VTNPQPLTKPLASYAHSRRVGGLVFIAGQGCRDPISDVWAGVKFDSTGKPVSIDFELQAHGVLKNVKAALLAEGLSLSHVVDVQVFLTDLERHFSTMNKVWNEYFKDAKNLPTRTTVGVKELPGLNLIEMKVIASAQLDTEF